MLKGTYILKNDLTLAIVSFDENAFDEMSWGAELPSDLYFTFVSTQFSSQATPLEMKEAKQIIEKFADQLVGCQIVTFE